jgi:hypothetical protein
VNRIERRLRNMINPYSTAFATWWCDSSRYWRLPRMITVNMTTARPGLPRPAVHRIRSSAPGQPGELADPLAGPPRAAAELTEDSVATREPA